MRSRAFSMNGLCFLALSASAVHAQSGVESYRFVELLPSSGSSSSLVHAINNLGVMVGSSDSDMVQWSEDGIPAVIAPPAGASSPVLVDINDRGEMLVQTDGGFGTSYVRDPNGVYTALPVPAEYDSARGWEINSYGEVIGHTRLNFSDETGIIWRPAPGGYETEIVELPRNGSISPSALNDAGMAAFSVFTSSDTAYLYDRREATIDTLPPPDGGDLSFIEDINNAGDALYVYALNSVVASSVVIGHGVILPFGCTDQSQFCQDFGDGDVWGYAVNESRVVVGWSETVEFDNDGFPKGDNGTFEAFVWTLDTGTLKLSDLIVEGDILGWTLDRGVDINDAGWIAGRGTVGGVQRSFLALPRDPCAGDTNRDGAITPTDFNAWIGAFNRGCD